jgi:hypothetical protein
VSWDLNLLRIPSSKLAAGDDAFFPGSLEAQIHGHNIISRETLIFNINLEFDRAVRQNLDASVARLVQVTRRLKLSGNFRAVVCNL